VTTLSKVVNPRKFRDVAGERDPNTFGKSVVSKLCSQIFTQSIDSLASRYTNKELLSEINSNLKKLSYDLIGGDRKLINNSRRYGIEVVDFSVAQINPAQKVRDASEEHHTIQSQADGYAAASPSRGIATADTLIAFKQRIDTAFSVTLSLPGALAAFQNVRMAVAIGERPPSTVVLSSDIGTQGGAASLVGILENAAAQNSGADGPVQLEPPLDENGKPPATPPVPKA